MTTSIYDDLVRRRAATPLYDELRRDRVARATPTGPAVPPLATAGPTRARPVLTPSTAGSPSRRELRARRAVVDLPPPGAAVAPRHGRRERRPDVVPAS